MDGSILIGLKQSGVLFWPRVGVIFGYQHDTERHLSLGLSTLA